MENNIVFVSKEVETARFCLQLLEKRGISFLKCAEELETGKRRLLLSVQTELDDNEVFIEKVNDDTFRFVLRSFGNMTFTNYSAPFKMAE